MIILILHALQAMKITGQRVVGVVVINLVNVTIVQMVHPQPQLQHKHQVVVQMSQEGPIVMSVVKRALQYVELVVIVVVVKKRYYVSRHLKH